MITDLLKVTYPIIQAPMLGVTTPEMVAAVSNEGGLGSLPVGGLAPESTRQLIQRTKRLTDRPFAVNLFAHQIPVYTEEDLEPMRQLMLQLARKRGYDVTAAGLANFTLYNHLDQIDILVEEKVPIVSFTFGCLDSESIQTLKADACILIGTATCVEEALFLQQHEIDLIAVQGIEAGGHRGSFIEHVPLPQIGLFSLLPLIKSAVHIPCIAAGGINSAQTMKAAFELGADAVQIGTAFITTKESTAIASYKDSVNQATDTSTVLTRAISGKWARGIRNEMMQEIEQAGIPIPPYPLQGSLTAQLRQLAQQNNDADYTSLWAGQSAGNARAIHANEVFRTLVEEYEALYR